MWYNYVNVNLICGYETKVKYLEEMSLVGEACVKAFGAEKMNYELLRMGDQHVHWHLFPRNFGDFGEYGVNENGTCKY